MLKIKIRRSRQNHCYRSDLELESMYLRSTAHCPPLLKTAMPMEAIDPPFSNVDTGNFFQHSTKSTVTVTNPFSNNKTTWGESPKQIWIWLSKWIWDIEATCNKSRCWDQSSRSECKYFPDTEWCAIKSKADLRTSVRCLWRAFLQLY